MSFLLTFIKHPREGSDIIEACQWFRVQESERDEIEDFPDEDMEKDKISNEVVPKAANENVGIENIKQDEQLDPDRKALKNLLNNEKKKQMHFRNTYFEIRIVSKIFIKIFLYFYSNYKS